MNKKILAAAIAASIAAPMAVAADVTIYGLMNASLVSSEGDNTTNGTDLADITSTGSRLGFKGSEDLGNGLKANFQIEMALNSTDNTTGTVLFSGRNTYVGLSGDFGEVRFGHHDTPAKIAATGLSTFGDQLGDVNQVAGVNNTRAADAYSYISPNFSGLSFAVAAFTGSTSVNANDRVQHQVGVQGNNANNADDLAAGYSLAAFYDNAGISLRAYYENADDYVNNTTTANTLNGADNWGLGARYKMDAFYVSGGYEEQDLDLVAANADRTIEMWYVEGGYTMGNTTIKGIYGDVDLDLPANSDNSTWAIGVDHKLSKRTMVWAQYADSESGVNDGVGSTINTGSNGTVTGATTESAWQIGMRHSC